LKFARFRRIKMKRNLRRIKNLNYMEMRRGNLKRRG